MAYTFAFFSHTCALGKSMYCCVLAVVAHRLFTGASQVIVAAVGAAARAVPPALLGRAARERRRWVLAPVGSGRVELDSQAYAFPLRNELIHQVVNSGPWAANVPEHWPNMLSTVVGFSSKACFSLASVGPAVDYVHPVHRSYTSWICECPHHQGCQKKRVISARSTSRHGSLEPLAYVLAWKDTPPAPGKSHVATLPSQESVDEIINLHRDALQACRDRFPA